MRFKTTRRSGCFWGRHILLLIAAGLPVLAGCTGAATSAEPRSIQVDILFLEQQPGVREALSQVESVLGVFSRRVEVTRYDLDTTEGAAFAEDKGLTAPVPLVIFINGSQTFEVDGRTVTFAGLPQGEGTGMVPDGSWTIADFAWVLTTAGSR